MTDWSKHVHRFSKKHNMSYKQANVSRKCKEAYKKRKTSPRRKSPRRKSPRRRMSAFEGLDEEDSDIESDAEDIDPRTLSKIRRGAMLRRATSRNKKKRQRQTDYNRGKLRLDDSGLDFYVLKREYLDEGSLAFDQAYFGPIHNTIVGVHNNKDDAKKESERRQRALGSDDVRLTGVGYSVWKQPKGTYKLGQQWQKED